MSKLSNYAAHVKENKGFHIASGIIGGAIVYAAVEGGKAIYRTIKKNKTAKTEDKTAEAGK